MSMALDIRKPKNYRRAWRGGIDLTRKITVCDACRCASCWQAKFFCDNAQMAGTIDVPLATLMQERRENEEYWFTNPADGVIDHAGLEALRRNYPKACAPCSRCGGSGRLTIYDNGGFGQLCSPIGDEPCPKCSAESESEHG